MRLPRVVEHSRQVRIGLESCLVEESNELERPFLPALVEAVAPNDSSTPSFLTSHRQ